MWDSAGRYSDGLVYILLNINILYLAACFLNSICKKPGKEKR